MWRPFALVAIGLLLSSCQNPQAIAMRPPPVIPPNPATIWPWPEVDPQRVSNGIDRWFWRSPDQSELELFRFDFKANPHLKCEIYDQDQDDEVPFDNFADFAPNGVGQVVRHLNATKKGRVKVAWNGLFFAYDHKAATPRVLARHIGPVVLNGKARYNVGKSRWAFGVKTIDGRPVFKTIHEPSIREMENTFDFAAIGAQCLVLNGQPLKLQPPRSPDDAPLRQPVPSAPTEAGHIPVVDHIRTSRTSMGWSKGQRFFYLLVVNEPDTENESIRALRAGESATNPGWTVADLQRFWLALGVDGAINSDGGVVTQLAWERPDQKYELLPPRLIAPNKRLLFDDRFKNAPEGGTLMTFYVRDASIARR